MSAIDHKKEALAWINGMDEIVGNDGLTDATLIASPLIAQVHATLALVEQTAALVAEQRTANLIANMNADQSAGYVVSEERLLEIQGRLA